MKKLLPSWICALTMAIAGVGSLAVAQEAPPISPPQLQKMLRLLDKTDGVITGTFTFEAPTAKDLGLSDSLDARLPTTVLRTKDNKVWFCRSEVDPKDYIILVRVDDASSHMFLTHADFKLARALLLRTNAFPQQEDVSTPKVDAVFRNALAALAKDVDASRSP